VDPRWRGQRARWRAHRSLASGRSGAPKLAGGGAKWRGMRGELGSGLTGARAALGEEELWTRKHAIDSEVRVVMAGGCSSSFYRGRGRAPRGVAGVTAR
jgi:hypothetical protein